MNVKNIGLQFGDKVIVEKPDNYNTHYDKKAVVIGIKILVKVAYEDDSPEEVNIEDIRKR